MSWYSEVSRLSWWERRVCGVLRAGAVPNHIAFIMDGNRRYARRRSLRSVIEGHSSGFEKLTQALNWCAELGVTEVTLYAFSIENFKRPKAEVDGLMDLAVEKFDELLNNKDKLAETQTRYRFFGNLSLLPKGLQARIARLSLETLDYDNGFVNICLAYTSQDEMTRAVATAAEAVGDGVLDEGDVDEHVLSLCMDSGQSRPLDLLIRTSGELRLSDFMLWQSSHSCLRFDDVLWPDFGFGNFVLAVLQYQRNVAAIEECRSSPPPPADAESAARVRLFLRRLELQRVDRLRRDAAVPSSAAQTVI